MCPGLFLHQLRAGCASGCAGKSGPSFGDPALARYVQPVSKRVGGFGRLFRKQDGIKLPEDEAAVGKANPGSAPAVPAECQDAFDMPRGDSLHGAQAFL